MKPGFKPYGSQLRLADGRALGYQTWGEPDGTPLVFFHGTPGARTTGRRLHDAAQAAGIAVLAIERPGYGLSSPKPDRSLLDWPDDVAEVADAFGLDRFAIAGVSGGGPYVCVSAYKIPERITVGAIMSGAGPIERPSATRGEMPSNLVTSMLARYLPGVFGLPAAVVGYALLPVLRERGPDLALAAMRRQLPDSDRAAIDTARKREGMREDFREGLRQGLVGIAVDSKLFAQPWGFALEDIDCELHLWHGDEDRNVPLHQAEAVAARIPGASLTVVTGRGHMLADQWDHVMKVVSQADN